MHFLSSSVIINYDILLQMFVTMTFFFTYVGCYSSYAGLFAELTLIDFTRFCVLRAFGSELQDIS